MMTPSTTNAPPHHHLARLKYASATPATMSNVESVIQSTASIPFPLFAFYWYPTYSQDNSHSKLLRLGMLYPRQSWPNISGTPSPA